MPKISVIMGVYNTADREMLRRSVQSVRHQTLADWEMIICDDGSTDDTLLYLETFAKADRRIRVIRNPRNEGLAASLNRCLALAGGEYIARQDADDYSHPRRFAEQAEFLASNGQYAFVGSNVALFDQNGVWGEYRLKERPEKEDFLFTVPIIHASVMFRKTAFAKIRYRVAPETRRTEDYDLFMRLYADGLKAANIQTPLYWVREDDAAGRRRKYRYRIDEAVVRYKGFKALGLLPRGWPYVLKPLLVGLLPAPILNLLKDSYHGRKKKG